MAEPMVISEESDSGAQSKERGGRDKGKKSQVKRSDSNFAWVCSSSD